MSRPRKQAYRSNELSDLTRQLLYSPTERRAEAVRHAEQLHDQLEEDKNYPLDFVVYKLTGRRVPSSERVMLVGEAISPDLCLLIDALSRSIELLDDPADPGMTTMELAEALGVSAKTIGRWRDAGLRWRWGVKAPGGTQMVLFLRSAVDAFRQKQAGRIGSAARFSRLSEAEKQTIIRRARRLARATGRPPQAILGHLAKRTGRSVEAIRQLTHRHDAQHPDQRVFSDRTGPLSEVQKQVIGESYRTGKTVSMLCDEYGKTRSTIYRAIHEGRAQAIRAIQITAIYSPVFARDDADEVLMQPIARQRNGRQLGQQVLSSLPQALKPVYGRPIQADEVVRSLVVRYNFLKYRASCLQQAIMQPPAKASDLDQFDELLARITQARGEVIAAMLPTVLSIVRRQQTDSNRQPTGVLLAMLCLSHQALIEEIDQYDPAVSHTLDSVLTNRLLRLLAGPIAVPDGIDETSVIEQLDQAGFRLT